MSPNPSRNRPPNLMTLSRQLVFSTTRWSVIPAGDRVELSYLAMAERLHEENDTLVTERDLLLAGTRGLDRELSHHRKRLTAGFRTYWSGVVGLGGREGATSFEDSVVERIAVWQVMAKLPAYQRDALLALADANGSHLVAARSLGYEERTLHTVLYRARRRFLALWFQPETPRRKWDCDRRGGRVKGSITQRTIRRRRLAAMSPPGHDTPKSCSNIPWRGCSGPLH